MKERIFEKGCGKNTGFGLCLARELFSIAGITIIEPVVRNGIIAGIREGLPGESLIQCLSE